MLIIFYYNYINIIIIYNQKTDNMLDVKEIEPTQIETTTEPGEPSPAEQAE